MILVLSTSNDATADFMCRRMIDDQVQHLRIDTDCLSELTLEVGKSAVISRREVRIDASQVASVWFRRPEVVTTEHSESYESQCYAAEWRACLNGFLSFIPVPRWVNHPKNNAIASYKIEQLRRATSYDLTPPSWILTQSPDSALEFYRAHNEKIIVKPVGSGYFEDRDDSSIGLIYTNAIGGSAQLSDFDSVRICPTLLQKSIFPKTDVRVLISDDVVVATAIESSELDVRRNNMSGVKYRPIDVPPGILRGIQGFIKSYGLRFSALDFAVDGDGKWHFFENNPNGQWAWIEINGGPNFSSHLIKSLRGNHGI